MECDPKLIEEHLNSCISRFKYIAGYLEQLHADSRPSLLNTYLAVTELLHQHPELSSDPDLNLIIDLCTGQPMSSTKKICLKLRNIISELEQEE